MKGGEQVLLFLHLFIIACMFIIGSLFGSFFSLATYRLPRHQDIVATRSYCPNCKHRLNFFDLIPVFSYLFLLGKCHYCKDKISMRYFLLELSNGLVFVGLYLILGYTINLLIAAIIYAVLFVWIGSNIMKNKMTEEEKKEVVKQTKKKELSKKAGVFVAELVVAMLLFVAFIVSAFMTSKNATTKNTTNIAKANANSIAQKNVEICLATSYDRLASYMYQETFDNISYNVEAKVTRLSEQDFTKEDLVKTVSVKVTYMLKGEPQEVTLETVKGKV